MKKLNFALLIVVLAITSCSTQKDISYLQDVHLPYKTAILESANVTIKNGDWLSITVNSRDADITQMLNLSSRASGGEGAQKRLMGYMVDDEGYIDFPQYGLINAKGFTLIELSSIIKKGLQQKGLVKDPVVTVQFLNYTVTVTGEVNRPGNFSSPTGRISILEALSMAGDLTVFGKRENVMVIREEDGRRTIGKIDLRSKNMFNSPFFYLHQNDVVYVEPVKSVAGQRDVNQNRIISTYASLISAIISLSILIFK